MCSEHELLSRKELASRLKRSERYVSHMRASGFQMPGGRTTLRAAISFLRRVPYPTARYRTVR